MSAGFEIVAQTDAGTDRAYRFLPDANLVTQLLAMKLDAPQTRVRRRAVDAEGVAAYGATGDKIRLGRRAPGASFAA